MTDICERLRMLADMINLGEKISWGQDQKVMRDAAEVIEGLTQTIESQKVTQVTLCRIIGVKNQVLDSIDTELLHSQSIMPEFKKLLRNKIYNELHGENDEQK